MKRGLTSGLVSTESDGWKGLLRFHQPTPAPPRKSESSSIPVRRRKLRTGSEEDLDFRGGAGIGRWWFAIYEWWPGVGHQLHVPTLQKIDKIIQCVKRSRQILLFDVFTIPLGCEKSHQIYLPVTGYPPMCPTFDSDYVKIMCRPQQVPHMGFLLSPVQNHRSRSEAWDRRGSRNRWVE